MEVVAALSQGRTAAAQCGLFTHKSVPVIFEPPCTVYISHASSNSERSGAVDVTLLKNLSHCYPWAL